MMPTARQSISDLRKEAGMTQLQLAASAGVSISTLYRAEQSPESVGQVTAAKLAAALGVATGDVFAEPPFTPSTLPASATRTDAQHAEVLRQIAVLQLSVDDLSAN